MGKPVEVPHSPGDYHNAPCPMADCIGHLYLERHTSKGLGLTRLVAEVEGAPDATGWQVVCGEGHVVLLPVDHAGDYNDFGVDCGDEGCVHDDYGRLVRLITGQR